MSEFKGWKKSKTCLLAFSFSFCIVLNKTLQRSKLVQKLWWCDGSHYVYVWF